MVTTPEDAAYDEWIDQLREEWRSDPGFLDEIRNDDQIITELYHDFAETFELFRLQAYFMDHSDELLEPPRKALLRSKALISIDATASFVFGVTAIELIIRGVLLRPMIYGLTHETVADKITQIFLSQNRNSDAYKMLNIMLFAFAKFDLSQYPSPLSKQPLISELPSISSKRNDIVHKGTEVAESDSHSVIIVADDLLNQVVPQVLKGMDLGVSGNGKIDYY